MKPTPIKIILLAALTLAGGQFAHAQSNGVPGATDYPAFSRFITERNIFDPNRQPHYPSSRTKAVAKPRTHSAAAPMFTLVGTMSYGKGLFAFFNGNNADIKKALPVSEKIADYTVVRIVQSRVTLESADKKERIELKVGDGMRQENGQWEFSGTAELPAGTSSPAATTVPSAGSESPAAAPVSAGAASDILRKLMEKRAQENQ